MYTLIALRRRNVDNRSILRLIDVSTLKTVWSTTIPDIAVIIEPVDTQTSRDTQVRSVLMNEHLGVTVASADSPGNFGC
jgi:hypothetical protein